MQHAFVPTAPETPAENPSQAVNRAVSFYLDPASAWEAMLRDCAAATRSLDFEQYILNDDEIGKKFLRLFADKAKKGVKVRLLLDRVGSRSTYASPEIKTIRANGGQVHYYGGKSWLNVFVPWKWFPRNHAKVMLIDDRIVYIGSVCIDQSMANWRDTQMRLDGILAEDIKTEFQLTWNNVGERRRFKVFYASPAEKVWRYAVHQPRLTPNPIYRELLRRIRHAQKRILLATPYFVPPWPLRSALRKAVRRGVKVEVMISGKSDVGIADAVSRSYFPRLLKAGVDIYLYNPDILHTKYAVVDDEWATIGSTNMDYLSLLHNREANVITSDGETVRILQGHFENDLKVCEKADKAYWTSRPWTFKLAGRMGRLLRRFL